MNESTVTNQQHTNTNETSPIWGVAGGVGTLLFTGAFMYFGFQSVIPFVAGGLAGMIAGIFAAVVAKKRGRTGIAKASVLLCTVAGIIGGLLLAGPLALLLIGIALLRSKGEK